MAWIRQLQTALGAILLVGCTGVPQGISPVENFNVNRYLGRWYEIARFDHSFERHLINVTADYQKHTDGNIEVINTGYNTEKQTWQQAVGVAKLVQSPEIGHLKVAFVEPFYASYVIFFLDADYQHAAVTGYNRNYLWLLSRTPQVTQETYQNFVNLAQQKGFDVEQLIAVDQSHHLKQESLSP